MVYAQSTPSSSDDLNKLDPYQKAARESGFFVIAGVDEVGRGPLAGPVVAAACILPDDFSHPLLRDSKKLSASQRQEVVKALSVARYAIAAVPPEEIDRINILQASLKAMAEAAHALAPDYLLVDGNKGPPTQIPHTCIVKGDSKCPAISAASILAKEHRDALMVRYHEMWPHFRFDAHKGYPTPLHLALLQEYGPLPIHRRSFGPVARLLQSACQ